MQTTDRDLYLATPSPREVLDAADVLGDDGINFYCPAGLGYASGIQLAALVRAADHLRK